VYSNPGRSSPRQCPTELALVFGRDFLLFQCSRFMRAMLCCCMCSSRQQEKGPTHSASIRKQVYAAIVNRNASLALQLVEQHFPEILSNTRESSAPLYLSCQNFIDKVRLKDPSWVA
jgi:hypothetical protein